MTKLFSSALIGAFLVAVSLGLPIRPTQAQATQSVVFVQSTTVSQTSGQTASKPFKNSVTSGDLIIVGVFANLNASVSVSDSLGDVFTQIAHQAVSNDHDADLFASTASFSGADTVTVKTGAGTNVYAFSIHEYSGVSAAVDGMATAQGNSTAPASGSLTTATANDLLFAWFTNGSDFQNENFSSLGGSYTKRELSGSGTKQCYSYANCVESADLSTTSTTTTNATATLNVSDIWSATLVAFKGTSPSGGTPPTDSTPPTVPANLTVTGSTVSTISLSWSASTDNAGVAGYKIYRGGNQVAISTSTSYTDTKLQPSTVYSYSVSAYDDAGNNSALSSPVQGTTQSVPDTTPPSVSLTAPTSGATVSGTITLAANASDNIAVASVAFQVDGTTVATVTNSPYSASWNSTTVANGNHTVVAAATDSSGNRASSAAVTISVSNSVAQTMVSAGFVQSATVSQTSGQTASKPFKNSVTSGDLIIVGVFANLNASVSVSDSLGDVFTQIAHQAVSNDHDADLFAATASFSGADTVTVSAGAGMNVYAFSIHEYSGVSAAVDGMATAQGNSTAPASGSLTTATANDLLFAWFTNGSDFQNENFSSLGGSYTRRELSGSGTNQCYSYANCVESADLSTTNTTTTNATATLNVSDIWSATLVAFKSSSSSGGTTISSVTLNPASVVGGSGSTATVTLSSPAASGGVVATLSSSNTSVATVPGSVTVSAGTTSATFPVSTADAETVAQATITATYNGTQSATLTVGPPTEVTVSSLALSPSTVVGGSGATGAVTLSSAAPAGGATVTLASGNSSVASVPNSVLVSAGATTASFPVTTTAVQTSTQVSITGTYNGSTSATLAVNNSSSGPVYPLKASSNNRYLVDQNNVPFFLKGDAPQDLIANVSEATASQYFADRASHGINAAWVMVFCNSAENCQSDGSTYDGIPPFTTQNVLSTPNPAYFQRVDDMLNLAGQQGTVVMLDALDTSAYLSLVEANNSQTDAYNYGVYLGNHYKSFPNIIWLVGNDFQSWTWNATDNSYVEAIMQGLAASDPNHLRTTELNYNLSGSLDDSLLVPYTTLAGAYTYYPVYYETQRQYDSSAKIVPVFLEESYYEYETYGDLSPATASQSMLRSIAYETMLSGGSAGYMYGSAYYDFHSGWQTAIDSPGITYLGYWESLFSGIAWYNLIPDQNHTVTSGGYGTPTGNNNGNIQTDNYVTTSSAPDGSLIMAYCPQPSTITVNMSTMRGPATAQWYDPTNGTFHAVSGSPFPNTGTQNFSTPGSNSAGANDWLLVLKN